MDFNRFYYHMTSTGARRVYLLLEGRDLLLTHEKMLMSEEDCRYILREQDVADWDENFVRLSPSGRLPVLELCRGEDAGLVVSGSQALCEYILECYYDGGSLQGVGRAERAKVRSFVHYVDDVLEQEAVAPILKERLQVGWDVYQNQHILDSENLARARGNLQRHLEYFEYILARQPCFAGHQRTLADIAASASLTLLDYLGEIAWQRSGFDHLRGWYLTQKRYCRSLLEESLPGFEPPENYNRLQV